MPELSVLLGYAPWMSCVQLGADVDGSDAADCYDGGDSVGDAGAQSWIFSFLTSLDAFLRLLTLTRLGLDCLPF